MIIANKRNGQLIGNAIELPTIPAEDQRANSVDFLLALRAMACVMVVLGHAWLCINPHTSVLVIGRLDLSWIFRSSALAGVWIFFAHSGYLMGKAFWSGRYSLTRPGVQNYLVNRILRIFPLYFFAIITLLALIPRTDWADIPRQLFELATFHNVHNTIANQLWSISTEVQYYLIAPILALVLIPRLRKAREVFGLIVLFLVISIAIPMAQSYLNDVPTEHYYRYWDIFYAPILPNLAVFVMGWSVNPLLKFWRVRLNCSSRWIVACFLALYMPMSWALYRVLSHGDLTDTSTLLRVSPYVCGLGASIIMFLIESRDRGVKREKLTPDALRRNPWRLVEWFGILSFGIYVWHGQVLISLAPIIHQLCTCNLACIALTFAVVLTLALMVSIITYYGIEKPFEHMKRYRS